MYKDPNRVRLNAGTFFASDTILSPVCGLRTVLASLCFVLPFKRTEAGDGENCFIFEDYHIVDWDLTRWYQEEDRKKHPEYYNNTVKLELVETYVRSLFDEICIVIEGAEKKVKYTRSMMVV